MRKIKNIIRNHNNKIMYLLYLNTVLEKKNNNN